MTTPLDCVVDNDVLIKGAAYGILAELILGTASSLQSVGVLGVARFVVRKRLAKALGVADAEAAISGFQAFLATVQELEPSDAEEELATSIQETATRRQLELDVGEAQLCAIAIVRAARCLLTGDKRAIATLEELLKDVDELHYLAHRVACLEQAFVRLSSAIDVLQLRERVCTNQIDTALTICFECMSPPRSDFYPQGLYSYIEDLRRRAATVLEPMPHEPAP